MSVRLAVAAIHGIGSQEAGFSKRLFGHLRKHIDKRHGAGKSEAIAFGEIHWADVLKGRQAAYLSRAERDGDVDLVRLRRVVVHALGDAAAYQRGGEGGASSTYDGIHGVVAHGLHSLERKAGGDVPLVVLAHSLGGYILSNFIWDRQRASEADERHLPAMVRMRTLAGIVTYGCNLPLFTFANDPIVPINFPGDAVRGLLRDRSAWLNFYDPDDILAYPLKLINPAYARVVKRDIPVDVGPFYASWTPASHVAYDKSGAFIRPVARFLGRLLEAAGDTVPIAATSDIDDSEASSVA